MRHNLKVLLVVAALPVLSACASQPDGRRDTRTPGPRTTFRRPALQNMNFVEGFNLVDRTPSGVTLAGRVSGSEITEWRVFDGQGQVGVVAKPGADMSFCEVCELTGGYCPDVRGELVRSCCWDNWGCLDCDKTGCEMDCETKRCRDRNKQIVAPVDPSTATLGSIVAVTPDEASIAVDPKTGSWSVTDAAGVLMHVAATKASGLCVLCTTRAAGNACWALPCLPARIELETPYAQRP